MALAFLGAAGAANAGFQATSPTTVEGTGGATLLAYQILNNPPSFPGSSSVQFSTIPQNAQAGFDFTPTGGTVNFLAGQTLNGVPVTVVADSLDEDDEVFLVQLFNAIGSPIFNPTGFVTIQDDDGPPLITINDIELVEGSFGTPTALFTVSLFQPSGKTVTVDFTTQDGTARSFEDYAPASGTLTFFPGQVSQQVMVQVAGDILDEPNEDFFVKLANLSNANFSRDTGRATILDDDETVITLSPVTLPDAVVGSPYSQMITASGGTAPYTFTVTSGTLPSGLSLSTGGSLSGTSGAPGSFSFTVQATDANGAKGMRDYNVTVVAAAITLSPSTLPNGFSGAPYSQTITASGGTAPYTFTVTSGSLPDGLTLSNAGALSGTPTVPGSFSFTVKGTDAFGSSGSHGYTVTISEPMLSVSDLTITEGNTGIARALFEVRLSSPSQQPVSVDFATADGTATAGPDYIATSGRVMFAPGQTTTMIDVQVIGDIFKESDEFFFLNLTNPINSTIGTAQATGTIIDDDPVPTISVNDVSATEGSPLTFTISLSGPSGQIVTVDFATSDGTAVAGVDYEAATGTVTFDPGQTTRQLSLNTLGDGFVESINGDTVIVSLTNATNATIGDGAGTGTILNDDFPSIIIGDVMEMELDDGMRAFDFELRMSEAFDGPVNVDYLTVDGTATSMPGLGQDYQATAGAITFVPGETRKHVFVQVLGDNVYEDEETFLVKLVNPLNVTLAKGTALGVIQKDDRRPLISIGDTSAMEHGDATFLVTLTNPSQTPISVDYSTEDGTATSGADFEPAAGAVTFAPYEFAAKPVVIVIKPDDFNEQDETFFVKLANPVVGLLGKDTGTGTIVDDDGLPALAIGDATVMETDSGNTDVSFRVTLSAPSGRELTVDYSTLDDSARAGKDYVAASGKLMFPEGTTTQTVTVTVNGDFIDEEDETFFVRLSDPVNATIAREVAIGTIVDNDASPSLSINDVTVTEGNVGTTDAVFTVSLSAPSEKIVTVDFATAPGTANLVDNNSNSGKLTFNPGETTQTITVVVNGDLLNEPDEIFSVNLSNAVDATIADGQGIGTIVNDDGLPRITAMNTTADESIGIAMVTVRLDTPSGQTVVVNFTTVDGTAKDGNGEPHADYVANAGTLVFDPGETTQTIQVRIENDDIRESNEVFFVDLKTPTNATIDNARSVVTITDDDNDPNLSITGATVLEGNTGTVDATFTVTLSNPSELPVEVDYTTTDGTAKAGEDYVGKTGKLMFDSFETSATITVKVNGDLLNEVDETFFVDLTNPVNGVVDVGKGTGTIVNDDAQPTLTVSDVSIVEGTFTLKNAIFTVTLNTLPSVPQDFSYLTANGTATAPADYLTRSGTITFQPGETTKTISVPVVGDIFNELDETFTLMVGGESGTATIVDDDNDAPLITSFSPSFGPPGTVITITGQNFTGATAVLIGLTAMSFTVVSSTQITATVPATAVTGRISVLTPNGLAISSTTFVLPPKITSFTPTSGTVGSAVTITGQNLAGATSVKFNGVSASFTGGGQTAITATVPNLATTGKISVTTPAGTAQSVGTFKVLPKINSFSPTSGIVGETVTIMGSNFTGTPTVRFGAVVAPVLPGTTYNQIKATVPATAVTGPISVTTADGTATTGVLVFTVIKPPTITSFSPTSGPIGTPVTINGTNLSTVDVVKFNGVDAGAVTVISATSIKVNVPMGATTGAIRVTNAAGTFLSGGTFKVTPKIVGFTPSSGLPGETVVISGLSFTGATSVKFGTVTASFSVVDDAQITATVPATAVTGTISVTTPSGTGTSIPQFIVIRPPTISSFTPTSGIVGSTVAINGTNLSSVTEVLFNGTSTSAITVLSATSIRVTVPSGATTGKISVVNRAGTFVSVGTFTVLP